jgi:hypothetical protein
MTSVFHPESKKLYTVKELMENGITYAKQNQPNTKISDSALAVAEGLCNAIVQALGADTQVPGVVNDLLGRYIVGTMVATETALRVLELMKAHNNDMDKVFYQLEEEGLLVQTKRS